jgi:single-stranded DNA-binding protein
MNTVVLTGQVQGSPHFHWVGKGKHKQAFVAFLLRVRGPVKEGDSVARCVAYGKLAESIYELLRHNGDGWYEVRARWRRRKGDDGKFHQEFVIQPYGLHHVEHVTVRGAG